MPKISVILPCYNVGPYIARCLDSLVNQTLHDIEIICVDDKSTDNTLKILKEYAKRDKRIKLIEHKINRGVATTRNDGMAKATGDYVGFVDPDDYVDLDFYEKLYARAVETNADVIKGDMIVTNMESGHIYVSRTDYDDIRFFAHQFMTAIYKRSFLNKYKINFPSNFRNTEDACFLTNIGLHTNNFQLAHDSLYHYFFRRSGSLDSAYINHEKAGHKFDALCYMLKLIENADLSNIDTMIFINYHVLSACYYEINKDFEFESDKQKFFDLLVQIYNNYDMDDVFIRWFGKVRTKFIKTANYQAFSNYKRHKIYLFNFLPIATSEIISGKRYVKLFGFIPLLKIK